MLFTSRFGTRFATLFPGQETLTMIRSIFTTLGHIASINAQLSKKRLGPIALNMALMIGLGVAFIGSQVTANKLSGQVLDSKEQTVAEASQSNAMNQFTLLTGVLYPKNTFSENLEKDQELVPMLDQKSDKVIFVLRTRSTNEDAPGFRAIEGMIRPMPTHIAEALRQSGGKVEGYSVDASRILVQGEEPKPNTAAPVALRLYGLALMVVLLPMALTFGLKYRIFRPTPRSAKGLAQTTHLNLNVVSGIRVSGELAANEKVASVFESADAKIQLLPGGEIALFTETGGSTHGVLFRPASLSVEQIGDLYNEFGAQPAVRFETANLINGRRTQLTLTFANPQDRAAFLGEVGRQARTNMVAQPA